MTSRQFHCSLRTTSSPYRDPDEFARLWAVLAAPEVGAVTYDHFERNHRHEFTPDPAGAFEMLDENPTLMVRGERDGFLFDATSGSNGTYLTTVWLDETAVDGSSWVPWILRLAGEVPLLFGGGCSMIEHDAKHKTVTEYEGGGSSEGAVGLSNAEFQKYLPGIYWLTVFGPELVRALDFSGLSRLPVKVTSLPGERIAVQLDEPLVPEDMTKRLDLEARVADVLGAHYFFDRNRPDIAFAHAPAFQDVVDRLARRK